MADNNHSGGGYDLPDLTDIETPEQADQVLNKFNADVAADPAHPYMNPNHPQNKDFLDRVTQLYQLKHANEDSRPPLQAAMEDAMTEQSAAQSERVRQGEAILADLEALGLDHCDAPADLTEGELLGLDAQRFALRHEWPQVTERIKFAFEQLPRIPASTREIFEDFKLAKNDNEKYAYAVAIFRSAVDTWHKKICFKRKPQSKKEPEA